VKTWAIEVDGARRTLGELTLGAVAHVCEVVDCPRWVDLDPIARPDHLCALLAAFVAASGEVSFDQALVGAARLTMGSAVAAVVITEEG
jgi:hypothetical protein